MQRRRCHPIGRTLCEGYGRLPAAAHGTADEAKTTDHQRPRGGFGDVPGLMTIGEPGSIDNEIRTRRESEVQLIYTLGRIQHVKRRRVAWPALPIAIVDADIRQAGQLLGETDRGRTFEVLEACNSRPAPIRETERRERVLLSLNVRRRRANQIAGDETATRQGGDRDVTGAALGWLNSALPRQSRIRRQDRRKSNCYRTTTHIKNPQGTLASAYHRNARLKDLKWVNAVRAIFSVGGECWLRRCRNSAAASTKTRINIQQVAKESSSKLVSIR
jgi:hypothetical protein